MGLSVILTFVAALKARPASALILLASTLPCFCQQNGLIDRIKTNYGGSVPFSASFELRISWKVRETVETRRGSIVLAPGDRFRVEAGPSLWVSDGKTLWQYDKTVGQAVVKPVSALDDAMLPSRAVARYCERYPLSPAESSGAETVLEWKADTAAACGDLSYVKMVADRKQAVVKKLTVIDRNGNESTYSFSKTVFGKSPAAGTFDFVPPKGARVLDQR